MKEKDIEGINDKRRNRGMEYYERETKKIINDTIMEKVNSEWMKKHTYILLKMTQLHSHTYHKHGRRQKTNRNKQLHSHSHHKHSGRQK